MSKFTKLVNGVEVELEEHEVLEMVEEWNFKKTEQDKIAYKIARVSEYPAIGDQLDAIWTLLKEKNLIGVDTDAKMVYNEIENTKLKHPKPE
jgi:hypothetical protein